MNRAQKMQREGIYYRFAGIIDCIEEKNVSPEEVGILLALKKDVRPFAGRRISSYAKAALDILGIEKNEGDEDAKALIEEMQH